MRLRRRHSLFRIIAVVNAQSRCALVVCGFHREKRIKSRHSQLVTDCYRRYRSMLTQATDCGEFGSYSFTVTTWEKRFSDEPCFPPIVIVVDAVSQLAASGNCISKDFVNLTTFSPFSPRLIGLLFIQTSLGHN